MTEYWKSNARKFCDYCKCWFADNRASIDFHEVGKKHKENVAKRLKEIGIRGREDYENSLRADDYMKQMEQAALKAYQADLGANPDMTGEAIKKIAKDSNAEIVVKSVDQSAGAAATNEWRQAKTSDGKCYYYHIHTKETKWEAPAEGFVTLEQQKADKKKEIKKKKKSKSRDWDKSSMSEQQEKPTEGWNSGASSSDVYGSWTTVKAPELPDLQLPRVPGDDDVEEYYVETYRAPHQFTQKTVTLGETSVNSDFKKRKNAQNFKKNARMRTGDL